MLNDPLRSDKFQPKYIGPYTVSRRTRWGAYQLRDATGDPLIALFLLINSNSSLVNLVLLISPLNLPVEKILSHRGTTGNYEYQTKWFGLLKLTWTPAGKFP